MSLIGRQPVKVPKGVEVKIEGNLIQVKGPKGQLEYRFSEKVAVARDADAIKISLNDGADNAARALFGLTRALIANMVRGVTEGFQKQLELVGVGYRAALSGKKLSLQLGFSHPVEIDPPAGISFVVAGQNKITVAGVDRQMVGQIASEIKQLRPVEPYKGKGIQYAGEIVRRKAGKAAKAVAGGGG